MQSFYFDGQPSMSNEEFDNLKEELLWEGSQVAVLRSVVSSCIVALQELWSGSWTNKLLLEFPEFVSIELPLSACLTTGKCLAHSL